MVKDTEAARVRELAEQLNKAETAARALRYMIDNGFPATAQQASLLRTSNGVESLSRLLEPPNDIVQRNQAMHLIQRMCRLEPQCQEAFIGLGVVRKLVKNSEANPSTGMDVPAALRALGRIFGGPAGPAHAAAIEDLFLSGTILRLRDELASRRPGSKPDELVAGIGELLAAVAAHPSTHLRLCDAHLPPLLPPWIESGPVGPAGPGPGGGHGAAASTASGSGLVAAYVEAAYQLSLTEAVAFAHMRNEAYFEALLRVVTHAAAGAPNLRRTALLTLCNVFGADADHVRTEEVLRTHSVPAMLAAALAATLGPGDAGAAARAAASAGSTSASPRRGAGGNSGALGGRPVRASENGVVPAGGAAGKGDVSAGGGEAGGSAWGLTPSAPGEGLRAGGRNGFGFGLRARGGGDGRHAAAGADGGTGAVARVSYNPSSSSPPGAAAAADGSAGAGFEMAPLPIEAVLHSIKCVAANPMIARKLARAASPSFVITHLLDTIVSSQQRLAAGELSKAAWTARAAAAAQTLLRLSSCVELVPSLRTAGVLGPLRMLALEADDPRVSEAARGALLYMGDAGQFGHASRAVAAAFRALYRNGVSAAGSEPELGNRFQVFVSHHRADAHQFALYTLYPLLVMQGLPTFVDPQHRTLSSDWAHMIACCRNLVVVLSEMLLGSPDHVREAEAAVQAGVHVVVVVPEGCRWADHQGNKTLDSPPPALLEPLPPRLRSIFGDKPLVYSSARHADFTQQLLARLRPAAQTEGGAAAPAVGGDAAASSSALVSGPGLLGRSSASGMDPRVRGRSTEEGHRVSFTSEGELMQLQQAIADEAAAEEAEEAAAAEAEAEADPVRKLPWPWSRLFDNPEEANGSEDGGLVRYPRLSLGNSTANGGSHTGEALSGSGGRVASAGNLSAGPLPPASGAPASYTSRRFAFRQRSSINRHAALQLQHQQQQWLVQQQWVQEFQQHMLMEQQQQQTTTTTTLSPTSSQQLPHPSPHQQHHTHQSPQRPAARTSGPGIEPDEEQGDSVGLAVAGLGGLGGADATTVTMLNKLLALQLEMVRYELRQAVQASHETITHKIDRLRSDVTEQVVQLRFDLAGKIETLQEAFAKAASASGLLDSATTATSAGGAATTDGGGAASPSRRQQQQQAQQQQLAQALSESVAASLTEVVNKAVAQLQATVAATAPPLAAAAMLAGPARSGAVLGGGLLVGGKGGHPSAAAMLAAAAAQQQQQAHQHQLATQQNPYNPHPPLQNGHVRGSVVVAPQTPHLPQGVELSPVVRAGAAAWSSDGTGGGGPAAGGGGHGGGAKSRSSHPNLPNGVAVVGGGGGRPGGGGGHPGATAASRPGPLAMFDAAAAAEDADIVGPMEPARVMSPSALIASVTSPATAQAALLMAGRTRQVGAAGGGLGTPAAAGGASQNERGGSAHGAAAGNGQSGLGVGRPLNLGVLPPLADRGPMSPGGSARATAERVDVQPARKAQQQALHH